MGFSRKRLIKFQCYFLKKLKEGAKISFEIGAEMVGILYQNYAVLSWQSKRKQLVE